MTVLLPRFAARFPQPGRRASITLSLMPGLRPIIRSAIQNALLRTAFFLVMPLLPIGRAAFGQAIPTAEAAPISTGFALPSTQGTLRYSIGVNESISTGYYGTGTDSATGVSGNVGFISGSSVYPFSLVFSGGDSWSTTGQPSTYYLNLGLSQVINTRNWNFILSDTVSYLPQTPAIGLSGVPGTGDIGVPPIQVGVDTGQGVLTAYSARVSNAVSLSAQLKLTGKTSLQASGVYSTLYFLGNSAGGVNTASESGSIGLSHRIDARNSVSANFGYSQFTYGVGQPTVTSQTATGQFSHQLTRQLAISLAAGPQWSTYTAISPSVPTSINLFVGATATYSSQFASYSLSYSRGTNSGSGIVQGARSDSVSARATRTFAGVWNGSVFASYTRTTSLVPIGLAGSLAPETEVGGVQVSRAIARSLSTYASYTLENQTTQGAPGATNVFSGLYKVAAFGLTYSPSPIHVGPR
jgi:hypothetical protein